MLTEKQLTYLTTLLMKEDFEKSPAAQEPGYQDLVAEYDRICAKLYSKLDERRAELLRQMLELLGQREYEHNLHYLRRGIAIGVELAGNIELSGQTYTFA